MKYQVSMKAARVNVDLTFMEVADALKVHYQTYRNWENGKFAIPFKKLLEFCELVGVPYENLKKQNTR